MGIAYNRAYKVKGQAMEQIYTLMQRGLDANDITQFVPMSSTMVSRYMRILTAVHGGSEIDVPERNYSTQTVRAYCDEHGLRYIPRQAVQLEMDDGGPVTVSECLQGIKEAFDQFAQAAEAFAAKVRGWQVGQHNAG